MADRREFFSWLAKGTFAAAASGLIVNAAGTSAALATGDAEAPDLAPDADITVLIGATLIDGTGSAPRPDSVLVLVGDRIAAIGRNEVPPRFAGVDVVNLGGRYVIPGLWDMHTHGSWLYDTFLPLHLANGITGIREMVGPPGMQDIRDAVEAGYFTGPRMAIASYLLDGPHSPWADQDEGVHEIETVPQARAAVREAVEQDADFVKVYSHLYPDTYAAIADEANRLGIRFSGHVPHQITVDEAVAAGQHTLEHQYGLLLSSSRRRGLHYRQIRQAFEHDDRPDLWQQVRAETQHEALEYHDPRLAQRLYRRLADAGTWLSPTLGVERLGGIPAEDLLADEHTMTLLEKYIHPCLRQQWLEQIQSRLDWPTEQLERNRRVSALRARMTVEAAESGVGVVAGSDCWIHLMFPGFSLHDELELLVDAGLSPERALRSATLDAARCLGREDESGTVEVGKLADLVVVDDNPLAGIGNLRAVHGVVTRGRYIPPAERDRMLAEAEAAAQTDPEWEELTAPVSCCG